MLLGGVYSVYGIRLVFWEHSPRGVTVFLCLICYVVRRDASWGSGRSCRGVDGMSGEGKGKCGGAHAPRADTDSDITEKRSLPANIHRLTETSETRKLFDVTAFSDTLCIYIMHTVSQKKNVSLFSTIKFVLLYHFFKNLYTIANKNEYSTKVIQTYHFALKVSPHYLVKLKNNTKQSTTSCSAYYRTGCWLALAVRK